MFPLKYRAIALLTQLETVVCSEGDTCPIERAASRRTAFLGDGKNSSRGLLGILGVLSILLHVNSSKGTPNHHAVLVPFTGEAVKDHYGCGRKERGKFSNRHIGKLTPSLLRSLSLGSLRETTVGDQRDSFRVRLGSQRRFG